MSDIMATNLAVVIDSLLERVQRDLCPDPEVPPTSKHKKERLERRREIARRNRIITERYYGLDGNGGQSMEQVGEPFGLTRESVRQITNKVCERLAELDGIPRAQLRAAIVRISERAPVAKAAVTRELADAGWWDESRDITGLLAAACILLKSDEREAARQLVCINENGAQYLVFKDQSEWPKMMGSVAMRLVSHNGAATIEQVIDGFEAAELKRRKTVEEKAEQADKPRPEFKSPATVGDAFVRDVLSAQQCHWLDDEQQWFTLLTAKRNRVINRLNRIFTCYRSALLVDVAEAIKRSFQKNKDEQFCLLPFPVLAQLIQILPGFELHQGYVTYAGDDLPGRILPAEQAMLDFIADNDSGVRREKELEEGVINTVSRRVHKDDPKPRVERVRELSSGEAQVNEYSFSMALNFSPLILSVLSMGKNDPERIRGHYRLVGILR